MTNEEIDERIVSIIVDGITRSGDISVKLGLWPYDRQIDRSLQRLRRAGRIVYDHSYGVSDRQRGWKVKS